jgi:hypothetical protein
MENENELLKEKIRVLEDENTKLKEHLKRYTAPSRSKTFYNNHRDEIIEKVKKYQETTNYKYIPTPEQKKEYNKRAYLKRKEKQNSITGDI